MQDTTIIFDTIKFLDTVITYDTVIVYKANIDTIKSIMSLPKKDFFDFILILIPLASILIASIALNHSKKSSNIATKSFEKNIEHTFLQARPKLIFRRSYIPDEPYFIQVVNAGLGPAHIKSIELTVNNKKIDCNKNIYMREVITHLKC